MTNIKMTNLKNPIHPGEYLTEAYLKPMNLTTTRLANHVGISKSTVSRLTAGKSSMSVDMAVRLSITFNTSVEFWLKMQNKFDLSNFDMSKITSVKRL